MTSNDRFDRNGIVRLFENDSNHMLASLGILFSTTADDAESDGCDEYWWRTAGMTAVIREIDRRLALTAVPVPQVVIPEGWRLMGVNWVQSSLHDPGVKCYAAGIKRVDADEFDNATWGYHPSDPWEALQAAIDAVKAEVAS